MPRRLPALSAAVAFTLLLSGCAEPSGAGQPVGQQVLGQWGDDEASSPWLRFDEGGVLTGSDGCNWLSGEWSVEDGRIEAPAIVRTEMWCEDTTQWLEGLHSMEVHGDELVVFDADGERLGSLPRDGE
ncbi:META domain-containing protein [Zhihengliuella alba]|uniref:META domain-containing protein n=2 Tax=Zhihengliuella alba TaxID=547018 RepID=A0ABP7CQ66_9MICC